MRPFLATGIGSCEPLRTLGQPVPSNRGYEGGALRSSGYGAPLYHGDFVIFASGRFVRLNMKIFGCQILGYFLELKFSVKKFKKGHPFYCALSVWGVGMCKPSQRVALSVYTWVMRTCIHVGVIKNTQYP